MVLFSWFLHFYWKWLFFRIFSQNPDEKMQKIYALFYTYFYCFLFYCDIYFVFIYIFFYFFIQNSHKTLQFYVKNVLKKSPKNLNWQIWMSKRSIYPKRVSIPQNLGVTISERENHQKMYNNFHDLHGVSRHF